MAKSAVGDPKDFRNFAFQWAKTSRTQISASWDNSAVVSSSAAAFASSQCDPGHFLIFPAVKNLEVIYCDISLGGAIKFVRHLDVISTLPANFRLRKPEQKLRILDNPGRTDARDGEEVKKRRLA